MLVEANVHLIETFPEELARNLRADLSAITTELGVVCCVTAVVSGLEKDPGFVNFYERLVDDNPKFAGLKFGKSHRTWTPASVEQLQQVATAAVEEFDHQAHVVFRRRDVLGLDHQKGNWDLVIFLCRLYSHILPGLERFTVGSSAICVN